MSPAQARWRFEVTMLVERLAGHLVEAENLQRAVTAHHAHPPEWCAPRRSSGRATGGPLPESMQVGFGRKHVGGVIARIGTPMVRSAAPREAGASSRHSGARCSLAVDLRPQAGLCRHRVEMFGRDLAIHRAELSTRSWCGPH